MKNHLGPKVKGCRLLFPHLLNDLQLGISLKIIHTAMVQSIAYMGILSKGKRKGEWTFKNESLPTETRTRTF